MVIHNLKILNEKELNNIEQFFKLRDKALHKLMKKYLSTKYKKIVSTEDYIVAVGDIPVALVAHLDTVFPSAPKNIFYDRVKNVLWSPEGLGADDRTGVYSIIQIIKSGLLPTIILTMDEEKGCLGAEQLVLDHPKPITNLKYIIELDRRGDKDCVFYNCYNPEFEKYIEDFGFITNYGTFSDISVICPKWKIAGVNLSVGYHNEHSYIELLNINQMFNTITKVQNMLQNVNKVQKFDFIHNNFYSNWHSLYEKCCCCGSFDADYPVKLKDNQTGYLCLNCIGKIQNLEWCSVCGEAYFETRENPKNILCQDCREKNNE